MSGCFGTAHRNRAHRGVFSCRYMRIVQNVRKPDIRKSTTERISMFLDTFFEKLPDWIFPEVWYLLKQFPKYVFLWSYHVCMPGCLGTAHRKRPHRGVFTYRYIRIVQIMRKPDIKKSTTERISRFLDKVYKKIPDWIFPEVWYILKLFPKYVFLWSYHVCMPDCLGTAH